MRFSQVYWFSYPWVRPFCDRFLVGFIQGTGDSFSLSIGIKRRKFFGLETLLAVAGLVIGVILLTALGYFSKYLLGRVFINLTERVLDKVPFINAVYRSVKQIVETFGKENRAVFKEVCLVEYPRRVAMPWGLLLQMHPCMLLKR